MTLAPRTIRARVALGTFGVLAVALALAGAVVDHAVRRSTRDVLDARLLSEAEALASLTRYDGRRVSLDFEDETMTSFASPAGGAYFEVRSPRGIVESSRSLAGAHLPEPDLPPAGLRERRVAWITAPGPREAEVRLVALTVLRAVTGQDDEEPLDRASSVAVTVEVARSLAEIGAAVERTRAALALALPLALVLGTAAAFLVARAATAPIARLAREARAVDASTAGSPGARLALDAVDGELRELAGTLNEAFDRLAATIERERRFSADAAHELRTPLAVARARLELALSQDREPEAYREAARVALEAGARLERTVDALLVLARAEAGRFERERVDLRGVAARAIEGAEPLAREVGARISIAGAIEDELPVSGDPALLDRMVGNLVENAVRHGGAAVEVALTLEGATAGIAVRDRGPGFAPDLLPILFERFARGDASRSRKTGGTGLGLSIARAIARVHGGDVTAAQRAGGGAEVRVELPRVAAAAAAAARR